MKPKHVDGYLAVMLAVVGLALLGGAGPAAAAFPGVNGKIVFQGWDISSDVATIASMDPDGTNQAVLASSPVATAAESHTFQHPSWSADGTRIAFEDEIVQAPLGPGPTTVDHVLFVMSADGTNRQPLTNASPGASRPSWSPDGTRIAYVTCPVGAPSCTLEWVNSDGTGGAHLVLDPPTTEVAYVDSLRPSWSPDGTQLAVAAGGFDPITPRIAIIGTSGQLVRWVTTETNPNLSDRSPDWSPDGSKLVFIRVASATSHDVWTVNADGTGETNLTAGSDTWSNPVWSPEGTRIAAIGSIPTYDVWTMNAAGGGLQQLTFDDSSDMPSWQPLVSTVTGVPSATGAGPVSFKTSAGVFANLVPVDESTLPPGGKPIGVTFPFGFFDWTITGLTPGQTVTVTMTFPGPLTAPPPYWKVINGGWTDASSQVTMTAPNVLALSITDGLAGDADLLQDGQISDPGGPAESSIDTTPPTITCPADLARSNDPGQPGAVVAYAVTGTDDRPGVTIASSPASGSFFLLGSTTVNATATDAAGNSAICSFSVTVDDAEPPVITAPPGLTLAATSPTGAVVSDAQLGTAHGTDNSGLSVVISRTGVPAGNLFPVGTTVVTYTGRDPADNVASAQQSIIVSAPPAGTACTVTGAGRMASPHPRYFGFAVRYRAGWKAPQGDVVFADTAAGQYLQSAAITRLTCTGTHAEIVGSAWTRSGRVSFTIQADDRGLRGEGDTLSIQWPGYTASGAVAAGDLAVRTP